MFTNTPNATPEQIAIMEELYVLAKPNCTVQELIKLAVTSGHKLPLNLYGPIVKALSSVPSSFPNTQQIPKQNTEQETAMATFHNPVTFEEDTVIVQPQKDITPTPFAEVKEKFDSTMQAANTEQARATFERKVEYVWPDPEPALTASIADAVANRPSFDQEMKQRALSSLANPKPRTTNPRPMLSSAVIRGMEQLITLDLNTRGNPDLRTLLKYCARICEWNKAKGE